MRTLSCPKCGNKNAMMLDWHWDESSNEAWECFECGKEWTIKQDRKLKSTIPKKFE